VFGEIIFAEIGDDSQAALRVFGITMIIFASGICCETLIAYDRPEIPDPITRTSALIIDLFIKI